MHYVPGEHDFLDPDQKLYRDRYGRGTKGAGWYSFDANGVHFIGLVNVVDLKAGGLGNLGNEQLEWLEARREGPLRFDPDRRVRAHPVVDGLSGMGLGHPGRRPGAVVPEALRLGDGAQRPYPPGMQKVEGNVTFHTARSTAFPQPAPGAAPSPGPMKVDGRQAAHHARHCQRHVQAERAAARHHRHAAEELRKDKTMLRSAIGAALIGAAVGSVLAGGVLFARAQTPRRPQRVGIDNFTFNPQTLTVKAGTTVTWTNKDDIPHGIAVVNNAFKRSKALDTDDSFSFTFTTPGTYQYFCYIHPHMTGTIVVEAATGSNTTP